MGYSDDRSPNKSSDDSFEADCYKHVEKKLEIQLPKCLSKENKINLTNHFLNKKSTKEQNKRVIRRRLSAYQIKAAVLYNTEKSNNNSNYNNNVPTGKDNKYEKYSESGDRSSGDREKQQSTYVLQAKVQHLLFEMKKLRQSDRDLLRQFYAVNDTIEELKWMHEEKEASLEKDLMEEEDELGSSSSNDDPYEKDMLALEDADVDVEQDEDDNSEGRLYTDDNMDRRSSHASKSGHTDTLDSGLTKSLSSLSLTNSSPTMSYQMSAASSRSHSPTDSTVSSSFTHSSAHTKSPTELEWEKQTPSSHIPNAAHVLPNSYNAGSVLSYNNNTYDDVHCVANAFHAGVSNLHSIDYVARKKEYRSYNDVSQKFNSNLRHKKLYSSMSFNHHTKTTIPTKITPSSQINNTEPRRSSGNSKGSASFRLLRHPLAQQHQIRRTTSFQENTPSLQPWRYRFVPIDENDTEAKLLSYDDRIERSDDDRYYRSDLELIRQKSQTLDRNQQQNATYTAQYSGRHIIKTAQSHRISGTGSAGSLTSQSSSSDSSTSSLQSLKRREAERRHISDSYSAARRYDNDIAHSRDTTYKRPLTTATSSVYNWVQSQHDDVMYF